MALYHDIIYQRAIKQCDKVKKAEQLCQEAKSSIDAVLNTINEHWQGESGTAYSSALADYTLLLNNLISTLTTLDGQMRREASAVLTEWPNNEIDGGE